MNFNASTTSVNYWVKQSANAIYFNFSFRSVSWPMPTCWLELNRRFRHSEILDEKGLITKWRKDKVGTEKNRHLASNRTLFSFREDRSKELRGTRFLKSNPADEQTSHKHSATCCSLTKMPFACVQLFLWLPANLHPKLADYWDGERVPLRVWVPDNRFSDLFCILTSLLYNRKLCEWDNAFPTTLALTSHENVRSFK